MLTSTKRLKTLGKRLKTRKTLHKTSGDNNNLVDDTLNSDIGNHTIPISFTLPSAQQQQNAVHKLLTHPRTLLEVSQDPDTFAFVWSPQSTSANQHHFGGVIKFLQQRLYPMYQPPIRRRYEQSSRVQGLRVHRHLSHAINCVADGHCSCEGRKRPVTSTVMNKHTRSLLTTLERLRITAHRCEVPIVSQQWQVGTRIDLIGIKQDGRSVLVSIKTGYDRHFNRRHDKTANLQAPLHEWPDTPLSHHRAQLLAEYLICKHEYGIVFDECVILYAAKQAVGIHNTNNPDTTSDQTSVHIELLPNLARYGTLQMYQTIGNIKLV